MSELKLVRGLIVNDEKYMTERIAGAFRDCGGFVAMEAVSAIGAKELCDTGMILPSTVDVVFLDSNLGHGKDGGGGVLSLLNKRSLVRRPGGNNENDEPVLPQPDKLVVVGTSTEPDWAAELGSYSDVNHGPLIIEWYASDIPLNMVRIVQEVRRLKP